MINEDIMLNSGEALKAYITGLLDAMKESLRDMTLEELQDTYHWLHGEKDNG